MAATGSLGSDAGVDLQSFLEGAGRSLASAQEALGSEINLQADMVIASAEVEAKVALKADATGKLAVQPLSSQDLVQANLNVAGISTLRISFVAAAAETAPGASAGRPVRKSADVIAEIRDREDVTRLQNILGELKFEATFVQQTRRWMVTARDAKGRLVREEILPDDNPAGRG
ncbi:MAG: hypothetical protein IPK19_29300 [Chloroflexi bacterium]|nr:hypothetical protein [Chloroflexota bacterium]